MKIVHVTDGYLPRPGGIEHHVHDLAWQQTADGHDVTVITTTPGVAGPLDRFSVVRPVWNGGHAPSDGMQHTWVRQALRHPALGAADAVHIHSSTVSPLAFAAVTACAKRAVPTVVTMHSMVSRAKPLLAAISKARGWQRQPVVWTAVSSAAARQFAGSLGGVPVGVLPNGVDPHAWSGGEPSRVPGQLSVACAGRLTARKRPGALLRILATARHRIDDRIGLRLVVAGDGPARGAMERYMARKGMTGWVELVGPRSRRELREIYAAADVYLAPATLESFGLAALEARCAGLPVIAYGSSGVADFVSHDVDGVLADSDTEMSKALVRLAHDPRQLERLTRTAGAGVPALSWAEVLPLTYATYARAGELLGSPQPAGVL